MIKVVELGTNIEYYYSESLGAKRAVNACFEQIQNKNYNSWDYDKTLNLVRETKNCFFRGNFSALKREDWFDEKKRNFIINKNCRYRLL